MKRVEHKSCPKCGCDRFIGSQRVYMNVICTPNGDYHENISDNVKSNIFEADKPYGPFICEKCGTEYETLPIVT